MPLQHIKSYARPISELAGVLVGERGDSITTSCPQNIDGASPSTPYATQQLIIQQ